MTYTAISVIGMDISAVAVRTVGLWRLQDNRSFIRNFGGEDATPIQHAFPTRGLLDHLQAGQIRQT